MKNSFPLIAANKNCYPMESSCPVCSKKGIFHPNSSVSIHGGAFMMDNANSGGSSSKIEGYFDFSWKGPTDDGTHNGSYPFVNLSIADKVEGGQFKKTGTGILH